MQVAGKNVWVALTIKLIVFVLVDRYLCQHVAGGICADTGVAIPLYLKFYRMPLIPGLRYLSQAWAGVKRRQVSVNKQKFQFRI